MIFNMVGGLSGGGTSKDHVPVLGADFTYSGSCTVIDDSNDVEGVQWRIKFLTSGSLVIANDWLVDLFLVGGGRSGSAGGKGGSGSVGAGGNGGAGGQCKTITSLVLGKGIDYPIVIGGSDGDTSALEQNTSGGGASGGSGGSASGDASGNGSSGTYEFGEAGSDIYGGGGGGGGSGGRPGGAVGNGGSGGASGGASGGNGGVYNNDGQGRGQDGQSAAANTGGGGGGGGGGGYASSTSSYINYGGSGGAGGSGIVIMRKHKEVAA